MATRALGAAVATLKVSRKVLRRADVSTTPYV
jgi:hypothetical protein